MGDYSTTFSGTENPLSEGGVWFNNSPSGQFTKFQTTGGRAVAQCPNPNGDNTHYRDSYAFLNNGARSPNAWVRTVIHMGTVTGYMEVEHFHRADEVDHGSGQYSPRGYEVMYNPNIGGTGYIDCARWSGNSLSGPADISYFELLGQVTSGLPTPFDGIEFYTEMNGNLIDVYIDGSLVHTFDVTDFSGAVFEDGFTGIGADAGASGAESANSTWCFDSFQTGDVSVSDVELFNDSFPSSIDSGWTNPAGSWLAFTWASAAHIAPSTNGNIAAMSRASGSFTAAQWCEVTVGALAVSAGDFDMIEAACMLDGSTGYGYFGEISANVYNHTRYGIYRRDAGGETELFVAGAAPTSWSVGTKIRLEVDAAGSNNIRLYTDEGSGFVLRGQATDTSITTGRPGVAAFIADGSDSAVITNARGGYIQSGSAAVASDTNTPSDSAVSVTQRLSVGADTNTPSDSAVSITQRLSVGADTNTPTDSAVSVTQRLSVAADTNTPSDSAAAGTANTCVAADTNTPSDSAVSITQRISVGVDTNTPTDSGIGVSTRTISASDTNTPTDSAVAEITTDVIADASDTNTPSDAAVSVTTRLSVAVDTNTPSDSAIGVSTRTLVAADTNTPSDSAVSITARISAAADTNTPSDSGEAEFVPSGEVVASDTMSFSDLATSLTNRIIVAVDTISFSDRATAIGPNTNIIFDYVNGTGVDRYGRMATHVLDPMEALPGEVNFIEGLAHDTTGRRYVTSGPIGGYLQGLALRADGVQVVAADATPQGAVSGIPVTHLGETAVSEDLPVQFIGGFGLDSAGRLSVTDKG